MVKQRRAHQKIEGDLELGNGLSPGVSPASTPRASPNRNGFRGRRIRRSRRNPFQLYCSIIASCLLLIFLFIMNRSKSTKGSVTFGGLLPMPEFQTSFSKAPTCRKLKKEEIDYTVVTQLSHNRLWMMEYHCQRWNHSISMAVLTNRTKASVSDQLESMGCDVSKIAIQTLDNHALDDYPVNVLRNMAMSAVDTSHVVYLDIDFWPSDDLYEVLNSDTVRHHLVEDPKVALVVPAFQIMRRCREWRECPELNIPKMPRTTSQLADLFRQRRASPFDPSNPDGHGSTLYKAWSKQQQTRNVLLNIPCIHSNRYEPYLVFRYCDVLPPFQVQFSGYGKNKMTWVMHLLRKGYRLLQIPKAFITHYPHLDSAARQKWNGGKAGAPGKKLPDTSPTEQWLKTPRGRADHVFLQFRTWLRETIPDERQVPICPAAEDDDYRLWIHRDEPIQD